MKKVSSPIVSRLPQYYHCVEELYQSNCVKVSSATLSDMLGFTASQIRQDFATFGGFGLQGYGYHVKTLRYEIREILGLNNRKTAILVGCGNLGQALLKNFDFEACGFFLLSAFDSDPEKIGSQVGPVHIMDVERLDQYMAAEKPAMAVLTVPRSVAPDMAEKLADLGVSAIWNFVGCDLHLEDRDVVVEQVSFADSLLTLSYRLSEKENDAE